MEAVEAEPEQETGFLKRVVGFFTREVTGVRRGGELGGDITAPPKSDLKTQGVGGTAIYAGYPHLPEKNAALQVPATRFQTFDEYKANIAVIATGIRNFYTLFGGIIWDIIPDTARKDHDKPEVEEAIEQIKEDLATMNVSLATVARRQAAARMDGVAVQEWTAVKKKADGKITVGFCETRPPKTIERWDVVDGELMGVVQRDPNTSEALYIDRERLIYSVDDQIGDSVAGTGIMRHAVSDARTMGIYEAYEAKGYENDMVGIPIGRAPLAALEAARVAGTLTQPQYDLRVGAMRKILDNQVKTGRLAVMLDSATWPDANGNPGQVYQYSIDLIRGDQGTKYAAMDTAINRRELRLARLFGIEQTYIGTGSSGGYAQGKDRSKSFGQMVASTALDIAFDLNRDLIKAILRLRGLDEDLPITAFPDIINLLDPAEAADVLWKLGQAGGIMTPDDPAIAAVRKRAQLPPPPALDPEVMTSMMQTSGMLPPPPPPVDPNKIDPATGAPHAPQVDPNKIDDKTGKPHKPVGPPTRPGGPGTGAAKKPGVAKHRLEDMEWLSSADEEFITKAAGHGVMIALHPPADVALKLSQNGGADADALHVTVAYLGKLSEEDTVKAVRVARRWAATLPLAVRGAFAGTGRFEASESSDGKDVIIALLDSADLTEHRPLLVDMLARAGVPAFTNHGYCAHCTLAYVEPGSGMAVSRLGTIPVSFGEVVVSAGLSRTVIPLAH